MEKINDVDFNILKDRVFKISCDHGFHEKEVSDKTCLMLVITEIAEAVEADRNAKYANIDENRKVDYNEDDFKCRIKDTVEDELADVVIRLLDLAGCRKIDVHPSYININEVIGAINTSNTLFSELMYTLILEVISTSNIQVLEFKISLGIVSILAICKVKNIDIMWHIEQKMKYNETRPYKHNKNY